MKHFLYILIFGSLLLNCKDDAKEANQSTQKTVLVDSTFNPIKWRKKVDGEYIHRHIMYRDVLYNDTVRSLNEQQLTKLLGKPDYTEGLHYYYRINENNLGFWTLKTKTMVVKFVDSAKIEWIKIHE